MAALSPVDCWTRLVPARWTDAWLERLAWAGPGACVVRMLPGRSRARLECYPPDRRILSQLRERYGGTVRRLRPEQWLRPRAAGFQLSLAPWMQVVSDRSVPRAGKLPRLWIPAGMAFGTGEHPTTAMCLRQLLRRARPAPRRVLDLGTGSGLLALAASLAGHEATALDNDPDSLRTARENARHNPQVPRVRWKRADVLKYQPRGRFDLITANLFSGLLQQLSPRLARWLKPAGVLILSGILALQEDEVRGAYAAPRWELLQRLRRGRWICLVYRRG
jgi:ribosomal protein L11 methyltransferase